MSRRGYSSSKREASDLRPPPSASSVIDDECLSCAEEPTPGVEQNECPNSKRPCGHHCNCSWTQDHCHWCGWEADEDGTP